MIGTTLFQTQRYYIKCECVDVLQLIQYACMHACIVTQVLLNEHLNGNIQMCRTNNNMKIVKYRVQHQSSYKVRRDNAFQRYSSYQLRQSHYSCKREPLHVASFTAFFLFYVNNHYFIQCSTYLVLSSLKILQSIMFIEKLLNFGMGLRNSDFECFLLLSSALFLTRDSLTREIAAFVF